MREANLKEWIGKNDDSPIPPRVRLRVFERYGGICHISGRAIRSGELWHLDHIVALINGGAHRESNLAPVLIGPHKDKTKEDVKEKAKVRLKKAKHLGITKRKRSIPGRRFDGTPIPSRWK